jgi:hypothetical protein
MCGVVKNGNRGCVFVRREAPAYGRIDARTERFREVVDIQPYELVRHRRRQMHADASVRQQVRNHRAILHVRSDQEVPRYFDGLAIEAGIG